MNTNLNYELVRHYLDNPADLPQQGYSTLPSDERQIIRIVNGERGYYPYGVISDSELRNDMIRQLNKGCGANPEQVEALMIMSMRGDA